MEIIRNKRASSAGGSIVGHQKTKYRKRSVSWWCLIDLPSHGIRCREPPLPDNAAHAKFARPPNGGEVQMVRGPYATLVDCVRDHSSPVWCDA
jgi:hypothetical protein